MRKILQALAVLLMLGGAVGAHASGCSSTNNGVSLNVTQTRTSGISPLTVWFDATGSTSTNTLGGVGNMFQDAFYEVNFGDTDISGTTTWQYGANPNGNSKNKATGAVVAHTYVNTTSSDETYTVTEWVNDGTAKTTCQMQVTVYAPTGPHGFSAANTTCVFNSALGSGCPAGAGTLTTSSLATATGSTYWASGKLLLFKCGDTFTGNSASPALTTARMGAYGTCQNQSTGRPQFTGGTILTIHEPSTDVAMSDLDLETTGNTQGTAVQSTNSYQNPTLQLTWYNIKVNGYESSYAVGNCSQCAWTQDYMGSMGASQGFWPNLSGQMCTNASTAWNCGLAGPTSYTNCTVGYGSQYWTVSYLAIMGGFYNGAGAPNNGNGIETVRIPGGNCIFISNTTFENANNIGAVLKWHCGNTQNTQETNIGNPCMYHVAEDNLFTGTSGAQLVEYAPQNGVTDERLQNAVWERNWFQGQKFLVGARNVTVRNNIFDNSGAGGTAAQACRRGVEWNYGNGAPSFSSAPDGNEYYNNTTRGAEGISIASGGACSGPAASNSFAANNFASVSNSGTGNTVSNNSASSPGFVNGSGSFSSPFDYAPTTNYTGATSVPNYMDYCGYAWPSTYRMGAFSSSCQ